MNATITTAYDSRIIDIFQQEDKDIGRASYEVLHDGNTITFQITADDATALRTVLNAITKLLSIWEKSKDL